jgi:rhamnulokinase
MNDAWAAIDLGVERGRIVVGRLDQAGLSLHEVHRFPNPIVRVEGTMRWNIRRLYGEILAGLGAAARAHPGLASVAIDTWGADFGLLDAHGKLLGDPYHHRDHRTDGVPARLHARVPEAELWAATGVQSVPSNTLYQLYAMLWRRSSTLYRAARLLLIPDLLGAWLCGVEVAEHTIASTTQCYDVERRAWITPLLGRAGIPLHLFPPVVPPATVLGRVGAAPGRRAGLSGVQVVAAAGHAAASAVAAIPAEVSSFAYISAGPSSLVGTVAAAPVRTEAAWRLGLDNEGGVDGTVCVHRKMAGLRVVQECRRAWERAGEALDDDGLAAVAAGGKRFQAAVDPDDPSLLAPGDMFSAILACCARTGQEVSGTRADLVRIVLESLVWKYRRTLRELERLLGRRLEVIHMIGEGARNALLCQLTADACGRPLLAGPADATALGNVLAQAVATGACSSWREARLLARAFSSPIRYEPEDAAAWDEASVRLEPILEAGRPGSS